MAEQILFSRNIGNLGETDSLFIQLSTETDLSMSGITPIRMSMSEMFSVASPIVIFEFTDGNGDLFNLVKPTPDTKFFLDYGSSLLDSQRIDLRYVKTAFVTQRLGASDNIAYKMFFSIYGWSSLTNTRRNRAWVDVNHSDIIKELVSEAGLTYDRVGTTTSVGSFIQPHWTNMQVIDYLSRRSSSINGGHMEFGCTLTGDFLFKTTGDMIMENKQNATKKNIPLLKLEGQIANPENRETEYKKNKAPTNFYLVTGEEDYMNGVVSGGGGCRHLHYDAVTDVFEDSVTTFSNSNTNQLSDWGAVATMDETTNYRMYGGRNNDVVTESLNRVVDTVDSIARFTINMEKAFFVHIGDMVELIIPTPTSIDTIIPHNIFYSGFYLICGMEHVINFSKSTVTTKMDLMREGFDGKNINGLSKSSVGKFVN